MLVIYCTKGNMFRKTVVIRKPLYTFGLESRHTKVSPKLGTLEAKTSLLAWDFSLCWYLEVAEFKYASKELIKLEQCTNIRPESN